MFWFLIGQIVTVLFDVLCVRLTKDSEKALELLVLRQQIRLLERRVGKPVRPSRVEKLLLALTAMQIKARVTSGWAMAQGQPSAVQASDSAQMASGTGEAQMDVSAPRHRGPTTPGCRT